jgi:hypothetical protein
MTSTLQKDLVELFRQHTCFNGYCSGDAATNRLRTQIGYPVTGARHHINGCWSGDATASPVANTNRYPVSNTIPLLFGLMISSAIQSLPHPFPTLSFFLIRLSVSRFIPRNVAIYCRGTRVIRSLYFSRKNK